MLQEAFGVQGCDSKNYGLHSVRSGGITSVAIVRNNDSKVAIVSETLLKLYDRCKTNVAKDMYIKEAESSRLSVSLSLGFSC